MDRASSNKWDHPEIQGNNCMHMHVYLVTIKSLILKCQDQQCKEKCAQNKQINIFKTVLGTFAINTVSANPHPGPP